MTAPPSQTGTGTSGLLWFFAAENWELLVKVLDGCAVNDRFWVFSAATTNVEYTLRVTDEATGEVREYFNPLGTAAPAVTDTDAFATCPDSTVEPFVLVVSAHPGGLPVLGTSTIRVLARDENEPLGPGHRVRLIAHLGTVPSQVFTDVHGEVEATFTAGDRPGIGSVTAILGASEPATLELSIRDAPSNLVVVASPVAIPSGVDATIELTALVANPRGQPLAAIPVTFTTEIGSLERGGSVITDGLGRANEVLSVTTGESAPGGSFRVVATVSSELGLLADEVVILVVH